ncbi:MAG: hypothetical protein AAGA02_13990, partial [Bacteroidota bacterium]
ILFILCIFTSVTSYSQKKESTNYNSYFEYDQEYGLHREKGNYTLTVEYNNDTLRWQADKNFSTNVCMVEKKTDKYIIAQSEDDTKVFYSVTDKQLFYLTKWETSFTAYGLGKGSFTVRELVTHMMRLINTGNTEADVISFLSEQGEYDF